MWPRDMANSHTKNKSKHRWSMNKFDQRCLGLCFVSRLAISLLAQCLAEVSISTQYRFLCLTLEPVLDTEKQLWPTLRALKISAMSVLF